MSPRVDLDHASTSPLRPSARRALRAWLDEEEAGTLHGDPGRIHHDGMVSRVAVEEAREQVAALLGARPREVVFTSGATEAIAAASWGALRRDPDRGHVVLAAVEHSAVRQWAERFPSCTVVGVDRTGRVDAGELLDAVRDDTALVHVQWGNHEVATRQPVHEVVAGCRERRVPVHVDAAQAVGHEVVHFGDLGADLFSVSGHKFGAPTGTGALLVRRGSRFEPLLVGGDQERARRAGLENLLGVVGLGAAAGELAGSLPDEIDQARRLTDRVRAWAATADGVEVLGAPADGSLPHLVCLGTEGVEPQPVLLGLDAAGIAAHSGSSCSSEALEPSPVLEAMGVDAQRSLRVSVGWSSTDEDVDRLLEVLPRVLAELRALRPDAGRD
ncbi:MAG: cysteine desulfurase family protein [Microthrixaceae bacterium]